MGVVLTPPAGHSNLETVRGEREGKLVPIWVPGLGAHLSRTYHRPDTIGGTKGKVVSEAHVPPSYFASPTWSSWHEFGRLIKLSKYF